MSEELNKTYAEQDAKRSKKKKTIITAVLAAVIFLVAFFSGFMSSLIFKKRETRSFEWALKTVQKYYYFGDVSKSDLLNYSLKGMVEGNLDRYSAYYTAEEYEAQKATHSGSMSGIGVSFYEIKSGSGHPSGRSGVHIERVLGNSPAYKSGLRAGEFITGARAGNTEVPIDGSDAFGSFIDARADGEKFTLITDRDEYEMAKEVYTASYVNMSTSTTTYSVNYVAGKREIIPVGTEDGGGISALPSGAAYMQLTQFYGNAADEMADLVGKFNELKCSSLILDLRGNGGGYVDIMCDMSSIFTGQLKNSHSVAMYAEYKDGTREGYDVSGSYGAGRQLAEGVKVSVLADCNTASASEALIGVLIDNGVIDYGDIYVSELPAAYFKATSSENKSGRTYGKGIMQTTYVNPFTHEALKLTTAKIYWPKGITSIHDVGVGKAQGCKTVGAEWNITYGDEQLTAAIASIYGG